MERSNYFFGLTRFWWVPLITGLVFIGFGVWCLCAPAASLPILAYIFAGCIGAVGIFNFIYGIGSWSANHGSGWSMAAGICEILFSIFLFFMPKEMLTIAFTYGVGIYIIFMTIFSFCESFMESRYSSPLFWFILFFLIASLVFSLIYILGPIGGMVLGWLYIGISFICYGMYRILFSFRIKRINKELNEE